ncbi:hypothetical protein B0I35DRAFT_358733 [Stachybotrys elegans]|uniref:Zn(2)-C6 fungal-type domain-containing protein n=1 Tax=Stachybotrys elegans TaxID=80388 RepID=A0A8K0SK81_9HYPO|nr:hypothetical protein B0I35DRAFT_358733 [Stachybotrys elegans]
MSLSPGIDYLEGFSGHSSDGGNSSSSASASANNGNSAVALAKPSGRKGSRKVRTGCITCKLRKVKCDESKPSCMRCVKTGRLCDGYLPPRAAASSSPLHAIVQLPELNSPLARHAYDYYRTKTAPILGGVIDSDFWTSIVLKTSVREPVVRHALLAVSSLHEHLDIKLREGRDEDRAFAFGEYGKAIGALRQWDARASPTAIPLIVCVLFICIEYFLEQETSAQLHISQGRQLLNMLQDSQAPEVALAKQHLVPLYTRLSLASFLYSNQPPPIPDHLKSGVAVPAEFESVEQARNFLYQIVDDALRFTMKGKPAVYSPETTQWEMQMLQETQQRLLSQFSRWNIAFTMLSASMPANKPSHPGIQHLLHIYYNASIIWISTALQPLQLAYDAHIGAFANIISHASAIINTHTFALSGYFSFETEIIGPIYWTAIKCRHPLLRRAALRLLLNDKIKERREGLWYTRETAAVASRVIAMEEQSMTDAQRATYSWHSGPDSEYSQNIFGQYSPGASDELQIPNTLPPTLIPTVRETSTLHTDISFDNLVPSDHIDAYLGRGPREPKTLNRVPIPVEISLEYNAFDPTKLESPFGIPEEDRVKNAIIGPRNDTGTWATLFRDGRAGSSDWDITRDFLKL